MTKLFLLLIKIYQKTLSPDHGLLRYRRPAGVCRYLPTCSEYAFEAVERYGLWQGGVRAIRRILRCHPWREGGWDPVK